ncbi:MULTISPECIES: hypothetical protein [Bradyrhizobium]|uniref:DUF1772 domain-containing protein n=2 Tax=Bradyrhizobium TaxID=374 RepID=A0ABY0QF91_9BRAD|nr:MULTISPECIES: hypothetical protein [Bradyrhizobium]SDK14329.1 hypothetical protein SAMN05444163_7347 [Bradyrhizobium ottawaense]SEE50876.1 hypothetical protein SAMN05444171_7784 [Bradyrhizobium lablabi]
MEYWLDIAAALFAFGAAAFWFASAYGDLPPMVSYFDAAPATDPLYMAIKRSARMNRWAAGLSGLSALCMAMRIIV